jgi:2-methylcitrate dehydratase PrpD
VHGPIDALLGLMRQHSLGANDIDAVEVATYSGALRIANRPDPQGSTEIQFSIPYCLGLVALDGPQALLPLTAPIGRPDVIAFARKVSLRLDPELDSSFPAQTLSRVTVKAGGQQFASPVTAPRGEASDPPSWERLEEKLLTVTRFCATPAQSASLLHAIRSLRLGDHTDLQKQFRAAVLL